MNPSRNSLPLVFVLGGLCGCNGDVLRDTLSTKFPERLIDALGLRADLTKFQKVRDYLVSVDDSQPARGVIKKSTSATRTASAPVRKEHLRGSI